jgi:hypothetical protein
MGNRPSVAPDWATDANHHAGARPWNGQPNKVAPSAGRVASGFLPEEDFAAEEENFILNNHGQWLNHLVGVSDGRDRDLAVIEDDFTGAVLDTGKWLSTANAALTFVEAAPAIGNAHIDTGGSGVTASIVAQQFKPHTLDFHLTMIMRPTGFVSGGSYDSFIFGLVNLGSANDTIWFRFSRGVPGINSVLIAYDAHPRAGALEVDSGFVPDPAAFATYEIIREGSTLTFLINGTQVHQTTTYTRDLSDTQFSLTASAVATAGVFDVDLLRGIFYRGNSGAGTAVPAALAHEEHGFSAVTAGAGLGHEYVDFSWTIPFAAATGASGYLVDYQISLTTDGDPIPTCAITNKTPTGFRVRFPSGGFNGEFRWSAK